jgi:hypothetical protein
VIWKAAERGIEICSSLIDLAKIKEGKASKSLKICYDEVSVGG